MPPLLVIIPDRLSDIISKGELQPNYYNPGDVFDDVHILMCNDDQPNRDVLQYLVGKAKLTLHNLPDNLNLVGQQPEFLTGRRLRHWAAPGVALAQKIRPALIRCHGADWNTYLASRIKAKLGIPYVVSLHINPDVNAVRRFTTLPLTTLQQRHNLFYDYIEREGLRNADLVMPVYRPILSYLQRLRISRFEVCYNVLNNKHLETKTDYSLHRPARIIYVGRLFEEKNPDNIMRALVRLPGAQFTIVGDGPIRSRLESLAAELGISDRVFFRPAVANDELCEMLAEQDIFAVHTEYWEISKSVLEALLTGLPVVINKRIGEPVQELEGDFVMKVNNSEEEYYSALHFLLHDEAARSSLGERALTHARSLWDPVITEAKYASIYRSFLTQQA